MKKSGFLTLAGITGIVMLFYVCTSCNGHEEKAAVATTPQDTFHCDSSLVSNAESDIDPSLVEFSFVFMGCNRVDTNSVSNASTANVFHLQRTFNEVCAMQIKPKFFFFLGDLVLGLQNNEDTLRHQLNAWVTQFMDPAFSPMPNSGIRLVALPGNHEMLFKPVYDNKKHGADVTRPKKYELPWQNASSVWSSIMKPFSIQIGDDYGISYAPEDSLTYSFNYKGTHFVLLNTDMYDPKQPLVPGLSPAKWICNDMTSAKKTGKVNHMFVMGHKPSYISLNKTIPQEDFGDEIMDTTVTNLIWPVMDTNHVEAMLSAHRHEFNALQPTAYGPYQIIAGNGGSKYERHLYPKDLFFGFTKVYVMKSGEVIVRSFGRITNMKDYTKPFSCDSLTRIRYNAVITWSTTAAPFIPDSLVKK